MATEKLTQPEWCDYPDATRPVFGCWSLLGNLVSGEGYCETCDCYIPNNGIKQEQHPCNSCQD